MKPHISETRLKEHKEDKHIIGERLLEKLIIERGMTAHKPDIYKNMKLFWSHSDLSINKNGMWRRLKTYVYTRNVSWVDAFLLF